VLLEPNIHTLDDDGVNNSETKFMFPAHH